MNKFVIYAYVVVIIQEGCLGDDPVFPDIGPKTCPNEPQKIELTGSQISGLWYITHVSSKVIVYNRNLSKSLPCLLVKITKNEDGRYMLDTYRNIDNIYYSRVIASDNSTTVSGEVALSVVKTDFENYMAVITCEQDEIYYTRLLNIWSRTTSVDQDIVDEISGKFAEYGLKNYNLEAINHNDSCT